MDNHDARIIYDPINEGYESKFGSEKREQEFHDNYESLPLELQDKMIDKGIYSSDDDGQHNLDLSIPITLNLNDLKNDKSCFYLLFAIKTSQVKILDINSFLNYQLKVTFEDDFKKFSRFLTLLIREYRNIEFFKDYKTKIIDTFPIISKKTAKTIKEWIEFYPQLYHSNIGNDEKTDEVFDFKDYEPIEGNLTETEVMNAFKYLCEYPKNANRKFLSQTDYEKLKLVGLKLPAEGQTPPFMIYLNIKRDKGIVYSFFHALWKMHTFAQNNHKIHIATYMRTYFFDFSKPSLDSIMSKMQSAEEEETLKTLQSYFKT